MAGFDYKDGEISYEVSIMGQTATVTLVRSENDYTSFAPAGGSSGEAQDGKQIELVESGYSVVSDDGYVSIYYAVKIYNPMLLDFREYRLPRDLRTEEYLKQMNKF